MLIHRRTVYVVMHSAADLVLYMMLRLCNCSLSSYLFGVQPTTVTDTEGVDDELNRADRVSEVF